MKKLTPVVPLQRGQNECHQMLLLSSKAWSSTDHSPLTKGARGIGNTFNKSSFSNPPAPLFKKGGELGANLGNTAFWSYQECQLSTEAFSNLKRLKQ